MAQGSKLRTRSVSKPEKTGNAKKGSSRRLRSLGDQAETSNCNTFQVGSRFFLLYFFLPLFFQLRDKVLAAVHRYNNQVNLSCSAMTKELNSANWRVNFESLLTTEENAISKKWFEILKYSDTAKPNLQSLAEEIEAASDSEESKLVMDQQEPKNEVYICLI